MRAPLSWRVLCGRSRTEIEAWFVRKKVAPQKAVKNVRVRITSDVGGGGGAANIGGGEGGGGGWRPSVQQLYPPLVRDPPFSSVFPTIPSGGCLSILCWSYMPCLWSPYHHVITQHKSCSKEIAVICLHRVSSCSSQLSAISRHLVIEIWCTTNWYNSKPVVLFFIVPVNCQSANAAFGLQLFSFPMLDKFGI